MAYKGHEPEMETHAAAYLGEASIRGKPMVHRKAKRGHRRLTRRKGKRG